ncbi:protein of unknown function [Taphrina deformans PYCC 5710]|uniref:Uncharacterized protein n=1 Tax=Taphrina deformans (strain PYCC 5710 / ATCC 11124 / CBS 356.35 / IMI 108563 / JCM 9778 / NBRC 8474) TaxID=1097556 RepID=R4X842_TAPDE|nr:protein of unknown function [Taphrina deformans PYCC 5710]|eukprot:CCG81679.1 protein of unknown function [Taphrina deformans PYCC 5710]
MLRRLTTVGARNKVFPVLSPSLDSIADFKRMSIYMVPKHESRVSSGSGAKRNMVPHRAKDKSYKISELEVQFLGTVSSQPTPTRAHTSLAVRLDGEGDYDCAR